LEFNTSPGLNDPFLGREQLFNQIVEGIRDYAIFLLDNDGYILSWNKGAERIKGFQQDEVLGKHFSIFYTEEDIANERPQHTLSVALKQGRYTEEGWRVRKDGSRFWASVLVTPLYDTEGVHQGFTKITRDLTERRQSEEKFRWILESAPDAIAIVDFEGKIQMVNARTESVFGFRREEMIGQEVEMLIPERFVQKHYHHREVYNANPKTRSIGAGLELYGKRKNGEEFPVEVSLSPVNLSDERGVLVFAAIRDITLQKQIEREIKELNEELDKRIAERTAELEHALANEKRALSQASLNQQKLIYLSQVSEILSSSLDYGKTLSDLAKFITPTIADWCLIHVIQEDGKLKPIIISHIDPQKVKLGFELMGKFPYDPVVHKNLYKVLRTRKPEFIPVVPPLLLKSISRGNEQYKIIHDLGINSVINLPLIVRDKVYGMMSLLLEGEGKVFDEHDLMMAKEIARRATLAIENGRLFDEAQNLNKDLEQRVTARTVELETINKELESFSYSVSHDLRAPLRSIDGFSNIILKKYTPFLDDEGKDYFQRVMHATHQMGQLIDALLKLARLTRVEMTFESTNLSEMAASIVQEFMSAQPQRKVHLNIEPGIIAKVDKNLIQVALHNLFENAFKYTRNNEVTEIHFGQTIKNGKNICFIRDNGVGFDMKYVDKLFGAFQRLHSTKEFEGTGIGLATVQRIIHRHKGRIHAKSELGKGATFFFTLSE